MSSQSPPERPGYGGLLVVFLVLAAAVVLAGRVLAGPVVGDAAHPVTFVAAVAGLVAMVGVVELSAVLYGHTAPWARLWAAAVGRGDPWDYRWAGTQTQLVLGIVAGGGYPWVMTHGLGLGGATWATFPTSVATGLLWGVGLFGLASACYLGSRTVPLSWAGGRDLVAASLLYLVYGTTLGTLVGLWHPLVTG